MWYIIKEKLRKQENGQIRHRRIQDGWMDGWMDRSSRSGFGTTGFLQISAQSRWARDVANTHSSAGMFVDVWRRKQEKHTSASVVFLACNQGLVFVWSHRSSALCWSAAAAPNITIKRLAQKSTKVMPQPLDPCLVKPANLPRSVLGRTRDPSVLKAYLRCGKGVINLLMLHITPLSQCQQTGGFVIKTKRFSRRKPIPKPQHSFVSFWASKPCGLSALRDVACVSLP